MAYKVCLLDSDSAYQRALMEYLNLRAAVPIQLFAFTSREKFAVFREREVPQLLLVGDEYADVEDVCPRLILTKKRQCAGDVRYLFRYQSADVLVKCMMAVMETEEKPQTASGLCVAVYSPLGRCGKTQYARGLCREYPRSLYVNWEGVPEEIPKDSAGSYILYCMKSRNEECFSYLREREWQDIPPPDHFSDIRQVEAEDVEWFCGQIREKNLWDAVVFDIGTAALSGYTVLRAFDRVFVPTLADTVSQAKLKTFEEMLAREAVVCSLQYVEVEEHL